MFFSSYIFIFRHIHIYMYIVWKFFLSIYIYIYCYCLFVHIYICIYLHIFYIIFIFHYMHIYIYSCVYNIYIYITPVTIYTIYPSHLSRSPGSSGLDWVRKQMLCCTPLKHRSWCLADSTQTTGGVIKPIKRTQPGHLEICIVWWFKPWCLWRWLAGWTWLEACDDHVCGSIGTIGTPCFIAYCKIVSGIPPYFWRPKR